MERWRAVVLLSKSSYVQILRVRVEEILKIRHQLIERMDAHGSLVLIAHATGVGVVATTATERQDVLHLTTFMTRTVTQRLMLLG